MTSEFEVFMTGLVVGGIVGLWETIARIGAVTAAIAVTFAVVQTVTEDGLSISDATQYWFAYLFSAARRYWPAMIGFTIGMFAGTLARRGR